MRIATAAIHQTASADIQRAQESLFEAQRQAGSERKADDLRGYARDANALVSARSYERLTSAYIDSGRELSNRMQLQDVALGQTREAVDNARLAVTEAVGLQRGDELMNRLGAAFSAAVGSMNSSYAGKYIFGGVREDEPPVAVSSLTEVAALQRAGNLDDAFENADRRTRVQLDAQTVVDAGPLASDVAQAAFAVFADIQDYVETNGPLDGELSDAERTFLQTQVTRFDAALSGVISEQSGNGSAAERVETVLVRQEQQNDYYTGLVAEIEQVDLAEVATRLSQAQTTLQASAQVYATLRGSTLLDLLR